MQWHSALISLFPSLISICNVLLPLAWTQHTAVTLTVIDLSSYGLAVSAIIYLWYTFMKITISCTNVPKRSPYAAVIIYDILRNYLISALSQLIFMRQNSMQDAKNGVLNFSSTLNWLQTTITKVLANKTRIFKAVESEEDSAYSHTLSLTDVYKIICRE